MTLLVSFGDKLIVFSFRIQLPEKKTISDSVLARFESQGF